MRLLLLFSLWLCFANPAFSEYIIDSERTHDGLIIDLKKRKCFSFNLEERQTEHCSNFFNFQSESDTECWLGHNEKIERLSSATCDLKPLENEYHGYVYPRPQPHMWLEPEYVGESLIGWMLIDDVPGATSLMERIQNVGTVHVNGLERHLRVVTDEATGWRAEALCETSTGPPVECTTIFLDGPAGKLVSVLYSYEYGDFAPGAETGIELDFLGIEHAKKFVQKLAEELSGKPWMIDVAKGQLKTDVYQAGTEYETVDVRLRFVPGRRISGFDKTYLEDMDLQIELQFSQSGISLSTRIYVFVSKQNVSKADSWTRAPEALLSGYVDSLRNIIYSSYNDAR